MIALWAIEIAYPTEDVRPPTSAIGGIGAIAVGAIDGIAVAPQALSCTPGVCLGPQLGCTVCFD